jgi:hypothetical protein
VACSKSSDYRPEIENAIDFISSFSVLNNDDAMNV